MAEVNNGSLILDSLLVGIKGASSGSGGLSDSDITFEDLNLEGIHADKILDEDGVSYSSFIQVPKYFQAILTLVACGLLLLGTLGIIKQTQKLCQKSSCARTLPMIRVDSSKEGSSREDNNDLNSVAVGNGGSTSNKNENGDTTIHASDRHFDYYTTPPPFSASGESQSQDPANPNLLGEKRVRFIRRVSGPYSDEAIDYVRETYKGKAESKYKPVSNNKSGHTRSSTIKKVPPPPQ